MIRAPRSARELWLSARYLARRVITPPLPCPERCDGASRLVYGDRSWVDEAESPDQTAITAALPGLAREHSRILHVGVGSSALARRWAARVAGIDGLTVVEAELAHAERLGLANYRVFLADKYREIPVQGPYDLILDNNLSSFTCCRSHFREMFSRYVDLLAPGGSILTERRGMAYAQRGAFALTPRALNKLAGEHDLEWSALGSVVRLRARGR